MSPSVEEPAESRDGDRASIVRQLAGCFVILFLLPVGLVALAVSNNAPFSPFDESAHLDYIRRIEQFDLPRVGDRVLPESAHDVLCRGIAGVDTPPCPGPGVAIEELYAESPAQGYQYQAQQPPLYYVVSAVARQPLTWIGVGELNSARLVSGLWLSAGLILTYVAGCRLGAGHRQMLAVCALIAGLPILLYQSSSVNNDAALLAAGAAAVLIATWLRGELRWWPFVVAGSIGAVALLVKPVALPAFSVVALLIVAWNRRTPLLAVGRAAVLMAGPALAYVAWELVRGARSTIDYSQILDSLVGFKYVDSFPWDDVTPSIGTFLGTFGDLNPTGSPNLVPFAFVASVLLLAAGLPLLFRGGELSVPEQIGTAGLLVLAVSGPVYVTIFYLQFDIDGGASPRYALVLLPFLAVSLGWMLRTLRQILLTSAVAAGLLATQVLTRI